MSCFFCKSSYHLSQNCNKYPSDEDRQRVLCEKKCCCSCMYELRQGGERWSCRKCYTQQKCYICFSKTHHTVFCPDRLTASYMFLPKLDRILLSRFMEILTLVEKYTLFLSFPKLRNFITLKPLKVASYKKTFYLSNYEPLQKMDLMVAENVVVHVFGLQNFTKNVMSLPLQSIIFRIHYLEICSSFPPETKLSSVDFLQLLSSKTKTLKCGKVIFLPKINICEILQKAPNLQNIEIHRTNIDTSGTWPNQLMEVENLEKIHLPITDINFDVESLATLLKSKSIYFVLDMVIQMENKNQFLEKISTKLSNYFILISEPCKHVLTIFYIYGEEGFYKRSSQTYKLKVTF